MIEKVNPSHPDKVADRIAGALVDLAYKKNKTPKIAVEVLIGHGNCHIICETSESFDKEKEVAPIVERIGGKMNLDYLEVPQDAHLAENQSEEIRCGDNGIFKGVPTNSEERILSTVIRCSYDNWPTDGKFIYDEEGRSFTACQSNVESYDYQKWLEGVLPNVRMTVNPLGDWTGGTDVDTGATNRKLGSDMGRAVTGGGLHGKDLSKADVSVNIVCFMFAQEHGCSVEARCAIGDKNITLKLGEEEREMPYSHVVTLARSFITLLGGFEKLGEWGLF